VVLLCTRGEARAVYVAHCVVRRVFCDWMYDDVSPDLEVSTYSQSYS
jgi:hypothetical protein